jgi:4-diphosphocytidyl-2-C-methyl-D-erythritol kinase
VGLQIISKRADGYHEIETAFYPISLCDVLEIIPSNTLSFSSSGIDIPGEGNLCLDAYQLLKMDHDIPAVQIHLHKIIPIGAGLGGGSSDAAFTLIGLNKLFNLKLTNTQLKTYALQLGADCPFFIENKPMLAQGIGEELTAIELNLSEFHLVVIKPDVHVSTAMAYAGVVPRETVISVKTLLKAPTSEWQLKNDFEPSVFAQFPVVERIKNLLYQEGAVYASMTGSGSAVFGLFRNKPLIPIKNADIFHINPTV